MDAIQAGGSVHLKVSVKTNTVTPRACVTVTLRKQGSDATPQELGPWLVLWPGAEMGLERLARLVPWGSIRREEDEEEQEREWLIEELHDQQHGQFFEGEMMGHDVEYGAFAEQFEGMSYWEIKQQTEQGEGYEAVFDVELSELGKAFLRVDEFLTA
jgi:hypothetical protein